VGAVGEDALFALARLPLARLPLARLPLARLPLDGSAVPP